MILKELVKMLNGREYGNEVTPEIVKIAANNGAVIVHGYSADGVWLLGAISDDAGCFGGGTIKITTNGILRNQCEGECCPYFKELYNRCKTSIQAIWDNEGYSWTYRTDIPHETFDIMEDGEKYCRGIVFLVKDIK